MCAAGYHDGNSTAGSKASATAARRTLHSRPDPDISMSDMSNSNSARPLAAAVFHILSALAEGDSHGYAIMQAVRQQSGGRVPLQTGSFYRHLSKLIAGGLVVEAAGRPANDDPRRGAYYRLTPRGRKALAAEQRRLIDLVAAMKPLRPLSRS